MRPISALLAAVLATSSLFAATAPDSPAMKAAVEHYTARRDVEAQGAFEALVKSDPANDTALHYLARLEKRKKNWARCAELLEQCTKLAPKRGLYWADLGEAYGRLAAKASVFSAMGIAKKSRAALEKAVEVEPNDLSFRFSLIAFLLEAPGIAGGSVSDARQQAGEIGKRDPYAGQMAAAQIAMHEEEWTDAEKAFRAAARLKPQAIDPTFALGQLLADRGRYDEAFTIFEDFVAKNPQNFAALYQVGRTAALSGQRLPRGEAALNQYLLSPRSAGMPSIANARFRLGQIFAKRGAKEAAKLQFEEALKEDPKLKDAADALKKL